MPQGKLLPTLAFGVQPGMTPFRLRQSRYQALAEDVAQFARERYEQTGQRTDLLDVGAYDGVSRRYVEANPGAEHVNYHAVDLVKVPPEKVYKHDDWTFHRMDLEHGMPGLPSNRYDVVICEQVLEHLHHFEVALHDIIRVAKPGGLIVLGVPTFPPPLHLVRRHVVPLVDRLRGLRKPRSHVQTFSSRSFQDVVARTGPVTVNKVRGFRIVSGGVLRPLEYYRWWWRANRMLGQLVPSLCVEVQLLAIKQSRTANHLGEVASRRQAG